MATARQPATAQQPATARPPSVDRLARSLASTGLPHAVLVDVARRAIADGDGADAVPRAQALAQSLVLGLLQPVVNGTGVLLHTNLGRAPFAVRLDARYRTVEFDLTTGKRGDRAGHAGRLLAQLCGAEAALVVNNNAAAVLLMVAALAAGREVLVSRGESIEIGGGFRVPEVMEQSGARLVDVGTTNRTRVDDYARAVTRPGSDVALALRVHPSNYRVEGFTTSVDTAELVAALPHSVPVAYDIGSGLVDAACPWLPDGPPSWLSGEPAARQSLAAGAALVTFSADKLFGGPQAGVIAGRADLVARCACHPLMRAVRPGVVVLAGLQELALAYLRRDVSEIAFWSMATTPVLDLRRRADALAARCPTASSEPMESLPGAGSLPGVTIASYGVGLDGDHLVALRSAAPPIIARVRYGRTLVDLRTVSAADDDHVAATLDALPPAEP